ncbi:hypothetical protein BCR44DRAFT_1437112 [Catenaria anguillulae PL171]|uniref:Uncharacterized protein n=1 Tax=Catenaria anguillulae PL171 TaxID=765915 RepID=A0A1Y2HHS5_9FUNG|nr:hypothetical protein BCR44DRAFT_1437112 [Catenaria anguillulae PL171]
MSEADGSSSDGDGSGPRSSSALSATSWSDLDSPTSQSPGVLTSEPNSPVKMAGSVSKAVAVKLSPLPSPAIVASAAGTVAAGVVRDGEQTSTLVSTTTSQAEEEQPSALAWGLAKVVNLVTLSLLDPAIDPWASDAPFNGDNVGYHSPRAPAAKSVSNKQHNANNLSLSTQQKDDSDQQQQQQHVPSLSLATTLSGSHSPTGASPLDLIDQDSPYLSDDTLDDGSSGSGGGFLNTLLSPISSRFRSWLNDASSDDDTDAEHAQASFHHHHDDMTTPAYEGSDPFAFSDFAARHHHHHHRTDSFTLFDSSPLASPVASSSDAMDTLGMRLFASAGGAGSPAGADDASVDGAYLRRWTPSPTVF